MKAASVVACVLLHQGRIALFRRSRIVGSGRGQWHCISGYISPGADPLDQARIEVFEEAGLSRSDTQLVSRSPTVEVEHDNSLWVIHTFVFAVQSPDVTLNWENSAVEWHSPGALSMLHCVWWLPIVLETAGMLPAGAD